MSGRWLAELSPKAMAIEGLQEHASCEKDETCSCGGVCVAHKHVRLGRPSYHADMRAKLANWVLGTAPSCGYKSIV